MVFFLFKFFFLNFFFGDGEVVVRNLGAGAVVNVMKCIILLVLALFISCLWQV